MTYAAPLDDMRFVLNRLAGLPEIATLPGFEDAIRNLSRPSWSRQAVLPAKCWRR